MKTREILVVVQMKTTASAAAAMNMSGTEVGEGAHVLAQGNLWRVVPPETSERPAGCSHREWAEACAEIETCCPANSFAGAKIEGRTEQGAEEPHAFGKQENLKKPAPPATPERQHACDSLWREEVRTESSGDHQTTSKEIRVSVQEKIMSSAAFAAAGKVSQRQAVCLSNSLPEGQEAPFENC